MRLLAFGGPLNEQMVDVDESASSFVALAPQAISERARVFDLLHGRDFPPTGPAYREVRYRVRRIGFNDVTRGHWESRCLVVENFPEQRIIDALNAVAGMTRLLGFASESKSESDT